MNNPKGAGRKPLPACDKKTQVNYYLLPHEKIQMDQYLKQIREITTGAVIIEK